MEIKSSKSVSISEVREILSERSKDGELGYEQNQALEHAERFTKLEPDRIRELVEKLTSNEKIGEELAIKIIDIAPNETSTLKAILAKNRVELSEEEVAKIIKDLS